MVVHATVDLYVLHLALVEEAVDTTLDYPLACSYCQEEVQIVQVVVVVDHCGVADSCVVEDYYAVEDCHVVDDHAMAESHVKAEPHVVLDHRVAAQRYEQDNLQQNLVADIGHQVVDIEHQVVDIEYQAVEMHVSSDHPAVVDDEGLMAEGFLVLVEDLQVLEEAHAAAVGLLAMSTGLGRVAGWSEPRAQDRVHLALEDNFVHREGQVEENYSNRH